MLDERLDGLRSIASANHREMRQLIGALSDTDLDARTEIGWTVRAVAGHIAQAPGGDIYVARRLAAGKNATLPNFLAFTINIANWFAARKLRRATRAELLAELDQQHSRYVIYIESLGTYQLDQSGAVMGLGRLTTFEYLHQSPAHAQEHAGSIRRSVGAAPRGATGL
jgi:hypothetical protein